MTVDGQAMSTPPAVARRPRRLRRLLLVVVAFLAALGAVTGGTLLFFYDRSTAIDRSTPQVVTDQFLEATLSLKDPNLVALFVCNEWSAGQAMQAVAAPSDPRVSASWGDFSTNVADGDATVTVRIFFTASIGGEYQQDIETWTLTLRDQDGWRVCDLTTQQSFEP